MTKPKVGIIGVGMMGHGIAQNVVSKGWPLGYLQHAGNQPTDDLDRAGAQGFADRASLAAASDVIILCVTGTPQVEEVLLAGGGVLAAIRPGTVIVDCSTAIPSSTEVIARKVAAAGGQFMDAAMTRTPKEAAEGRLNLLVGGDLAVFETVKSLLEAFAENIFYAGPAGAGHKLKLLHNYISLGFTTLLGEAAACAAAGGIAPEVFVDALQRGGGFGAALDRVSPYILRGEVAAMRFTNANARKDISYYVQMAADLGAHREAATGLLAALDGLLAAGHGGAMVPEQVRLFGEMAKAAKGQPPKAS